MLIRKISLIGMLVTGGISEAAAQQALQLPIDADNCTIQMALSPERSGNCLPATLGNTRGIVLKINSVLKNTPHANTTRIASVATTASLTKLQKKNSRKAAKPGAGYFIQFAFDSAKLEPEFKEHLNRLSEVLKVEAMANNCLKIIGHTDTVGPANYNRKLSQKRALTIYNYLQKQRDIPAFRLMTEAAGETQPLPGIPGDDALNRRVEFVTRESDTGCS